MTPEQLQAHVEDLKAMRDDRARDAARTDAAMARLLRAQVRAFNLALDSLYQHSDHRYGEPYPTDTKNGDTHE